MKYRRISLCLSIILTVMVANVSCADNEEMIETDMESESSAETTAENAYDYVFPELDCNGEDFTILNCEYVWDMYTYLDFEEMTGETLDDAVYERNRAIEDRYNIEIVIEEIPIDDLAPKIIQTVTAGDDVYDVAYSRGDKINSVITGGYVKNLYDVPRLMLDKPWWNQSVISEATLGDSDAVYFALNDFSL